MKLKKILATVLALTVLVCFTACGSKAEGSDEVVAKIGETEITMAELETYAGITCMMYYGMDYSTIDKSYKDYVLQMLLNGLVESKMAEMYCEKNKIDVEGQEDYADGLKDFISSVKTDENLSKIYKNCKLDKSDLKAYYHGVSAGNAIYEELRSGIDDLDAETANYYEEHKADYTVQEAEATVSHILVDDETTAKEVKAKLDAGEDFAKLAKKYSKDGSASNGGLLGTYTESNCNWVEEFKKAAFALAKGEISDPVKSEFGYHIIYVSDRNEAGTVKTLEEAKEDIEQQILYNLYTKKMGELEKEYQVEYLLTVDNGDAPAAENGAAAEDGAAAAPADTQNGTETPEE